MTKRGCIVLIADRDYEIGWNESGWFACDVTGEEPASSDYYGTERELVEAIEMGIAAFG